MEYRAMSWRAAEAKLVMPALLWRLRSHRRPYEVSWRGKRLTVLPGVFSPRYDGVGRFAVDCLPPLAGKSFLELGSGCGFISVFAALAGAALVVAVDISPLAAQNTRLNFDAHQLANAHTVQGNLMEAISCKFDCILFSPPFYHGRARDWLERAVFDEDLAVVSRFIADARRCLAPGGVVLLGGPRSGNDALLRAQAQRAGLEVVEVRSFGIPGFGGKVHKLRAT
jgi:methylase of polypeptide subunit release factors